MLDSISHDIRYAVRSLLRSPGYAIVAILCLSLGIAANVTVFTPVNTLLLRPLPFTDPDRVMSVYTTLERDRRFEGSWSYADYLDVGNAGGTFASAGLFDDRQVNIGGLDEPERVQGARMTASVFPTLGIRIDSRTRLPRRRGRSRERSCSSATASGSGSSPATARSSDVRSRSTASRTRSSASSRRRSSSPSSRTSGSRSSRAR